MELCSGQKSGCCVLRGVRVLCPGQELGCYILGRNWGAVSWGAAIGVLCPGPELRCCVLGRNRVAVSWVRLEPSLLALSHPEPPEKQRCDAHSAADAKVEAETDAFTRCLFTRTLVQISLKIARECIQFS